ncbi:pyridoxal-dependent decarboxylase, pyridoxal binding domain-containing protein [Phthorimaea operculella]|nr:pyridoxal-dependent decarboxylase, pyridoxal binding domain-containing protein [Phthorimaea operculella]
MDTIHNEAFVLDDNTAEDVAEAMIEGGRQRKPFHVFDMDEVYHRVQHFREMMPRVQIYFALKSNNHDMFLKLAISLGLGFDCASPGEIQKIIKLGVHPRSIIDTLPSRHPDHLEYARLAGVRHATFDTSYELQKMKQYWPDVSLLIRIRVESDSIYKLGEKFGADPETEAFDLLDEAASLGLRVAGVAFHVGSACFTPASFDTALRNAHKLFEHEAQAGRRMSIVDIGGGFLSDGIHIIDEVARVAFDMGSTCFTPASLNIALRHVHKLFEHEAQAGRRMSIVDIGGGFLSDGIHIIDEVGV